jgi:hypothetical protein
VAAGNEREALLRVADRLCDALACSEREAPSPAEGGSPLDWPQRGVPAELLGSEDERWVAKMRGCLARIAAAVAARNGEELPRREVGAALDGAESVIRGELANGNAARLPALMPGFVFLVTLPIVEQDRALDLSRQTSELIEGPFED